MRRKQNKAPVLLPLEERLRVARAVNVYRKTHPHMRLAEVLQAAAPELSESNYYAWNKRLELAEATRKANSAEKANGADHADASSGTQSFPLSIIPERTSRAATPAKRGAYRGRDEDKELAGSLLEIAARLLKRG